MKSDIKHLVLALFSGGIGQIDHAHLEKDEGEISMKVVKIGGPAYRIGMGGGAASSVPSGSNKANLDFNAVQVHEKYILWHKKKNHTNIDLN